MTIVVILKNGVEIPVTCSNVETETKFGELASYKFIGITSNKPIYLAPDQIAAFVRVMSDETEDAREGVQADD